MTIELTDEQKRMVDLAVASGAYHSSDEVIGTALAMLYEDIEDGIISDAREENHVLVWITSKPNSGRSARSSDVEAIERIRPKIRGLATEPGLRDVKSFMATRTAGESVLVIIGWFTPLTTQPEPST